MSALGSDQKPGRGSARDLAHDSGVRRVPGGKAFDGLMASILPRREDRVGLHGQGPESLRMG
ncbi:MAG: hypothetical protein ABSF77_19825 [Spirochaetia bacterium]